MEGTRTGEKRQPTNAGQGAGGCCLLLPIRRRGVWWPTDGGLGLGLLPTLAGWFGLVCYLYALLFYVGGPDFLQAARLLVLL